MSTELPHRGRSTIISFGRCAVGPAQRQTEEHVFKDRIAWMDYWMLDHGRADLGMKAGTADLATAFGPRETPTTTSRVILGYQGEGQGGGEVARAASRSRRRSSPTPT